VFGYLFAMAFFCIVLITLRVAWTVVVRHLWVEGDATIEAAATDGNVINGDKNDRREEEQRAGKPAENNVESADDLKVCGAWRWSMSDSE
jgi:hypothetical protein